jgi:hypothetical protein
MITGPGTALFRQLFSVGKGVDDAMAVKNPDQVLFKGDITEDGLTVGR